MRKWSTEFGNMINPDYTMNLNIMGRPDGTTNMGKEISLKLIKACMIKTCVRAPVENDTEV